MDAGRWQKLCFLDIVLVTDFKEYGQNDSGTHRCEDNEVQILT